MKASLVQHRQAVVYAATPGREPYRGAVAAELASSGCTVRRWRNRTTGVAYTHDDDWGIEVPEPRGPVSACTCLHEIAHQLLHRPGQGSSSGPRWREEWEAWAWALQAYQRHGLPRYAQAQDDAAGCLRHAARKALRRTRAPEALAARIVAAYPAWVWGSSGLVVCTVRGAEITLRAAA